MCDYVQQMVLATSVTCGSVIVTVIMAVADVIQLFRPNKPRINGWLPAKVDIQWLQSTKVT